MWWFWRGIHLRSKKLLVCVPPLSANDTHKGSTICPTSEIVCLPVLIFTFSHVENALFFALDLVVFLQLELLFQTYQLVYYNLYNFLRLLLKSPSLFLSLILLNNILIEVVS